MGQMDIDWLFETNALRVSPADAPFWYTSGLIGPYYINTHFLCGGEQKAVEVLAFIDQEAEAKATFPAKMRSKLEEIERDFPIFRGVIEALVEATRNKVPEDQIDYVSGGQRRDWFFAPLVAKHLNKPCIYLYNDLSAIDESGNPISDLAGGKVLNVADLLTVGSSYTKKWIPAIAALGGSLTSAANVVDRNEGATENLSKDGVTNCFSLFTIEQALVDEAHARGALDANQHQLVSNFLTDPFNSMRDFLIAHPEFIERAQQSENDRTRQRCKLLLEEDLYKL